MVAVEVVYKFCIKSRKMNVGYVCIEERELYFVPAELYTCSMMVVQPESTQVEVVGCTVQI